MSQEINHSEKMKTKDVITVTLLTLINLVIFGFSSFLYIAPVTILLMPVMFSILEGIAFFLIGFKVRKKGAMLQYCVIHGVIGFYPPYVLLYILGGVISEHLLKRSGYGDPKALTVSYVIIQLLACIGSTIFPYTVAFNYMMEHSTPDVRQDTIVQAAGMVQQFGWYVLPIVVIILSILGAKLGRKIAEKHL